MLIDANGQLDGTRVETDVCVVGSGPAGISLAMELAGSSCRVMLLEAGGLVESRAAQQLAGGEVAGQAYYRLDRTRIRAFGGASNHWIETGGMRARPLEELDFTSRPEIGRIGWPFGRDVLEPHYRRAQEICHLGPYDYGLSRWEVPGELQALPLREDLVRTTMFQVGPLGQFAACLPDLLGAANVSIMLNANVLEVLTNDHGTRATHVEVAGRPGHRFQVAATIVVLAAGGIENPRLLLASRRTHRHGLGNEHGLVGRFFMEHPHLRTGVVVPRGDLPDLSLYEPHVMNGTVNFGMLTLPDDVLRSEQLLASAWALHPTPAALTTPQGRALVGLRENLGFRRVLPGTAARLRAVAQDPRASLGAVLTARRRGSQGSHISLWAMTEQEPNPSSRVTLSTRQDRFGSPMARVDWQMSDLDRWSIRRFQELVGEAFDQAGIGTVQQRFAEDEVPEVVGGGFHHIGTTRMHRTPREGVVDGNGQVHGVDNLYVAGMSTFPTAGYANPTLTVVALAVRLAQRIRRSWESPITIAER